MKNTQQGRSMVEMLGVLAIIGVLSVAGIAGYSTAMNKYRTTKLLDFVQMTTMNIRTLFSAQGTYEGLSNRLLYNLGAVDNTLCPGGGSGTGDLVCNNGFPGGTFELRPTTETGANADTSFEVEMTNLPRNVCVSVLTSDWGTTASGFISIQAGNASTHTVSPVLLTEAVDECAGSGTGGNAIVDQVIIRFQ